MATAFSILGTVKVETKSAVSSIRTFVQTATNLLNTVNKAAADVGKNIKPITVTVNTSQAMASLQSFSKLAAAQLAANLKPVTVKVNTSQALNSIRTYTTTANALLNTVNTTGANLANGLKPLLTTATNAAKVLNRTATATQRTSRATNQATRDTHELNRAMAMVSASRLASQFQDLAEYILNAASTMQGFQRSLTGATGSAKEAADTVKMVAKFAEKSPFENVDLNTIATKFAVMKQPIEENMVLASKLAYLFKKDLVDSGNIVAEANEGVIHSLRRLNTQFGFTVAKAQQYGAIVAGGHIVIGDKGSEANNRLMAAIRGYVSNNEQALGGDIFKDAEKDIGAALSNIKDAAFQLAATLGQEAGPAIVAFSKILIDFIHWLQDGPRFMQMAAAGITLLAGAAGLVIQTVGPAVVLFSRLNMLLGTTATASTTAAAGLGKVGPNAVAATGGMTAMTGALGVALLAVVALSLASAAYMDHLKSLDRKVDESAKKQAALYTASKTGFALMMGDKGGLSQLTTSDVKALSSEQRTDVYNRLASELPAARERAAAAQDRDPNLPPAMRAKLADIERRRTAEMTAASAANGGQALSDADRGRIDKKYSAEEMKVRSTDKGFDAVRDRERILDMLEAAQVKEAAGLFKKSLVDLTDAVMGRSKKIAAANEPARPREYHEIDFEFKQQAKLRDINQGLNDRDYTEKLKKLDKEAGEALVEAQRAKLVTYFSAENRVPMKQAQELTGKILSAKDDSGFEALGKQYGLDKSKMKYASKIYSGAGSDEKQVAARLALRKASIDAQKKENDLLIDKLRMSEKIAEIEHKSTPTTRLSAIHAELEAVEYAHKAELISDAELGKAKRDLHLQAVQERRKEADAQRDANIDLKALYGQDVTSKGMALQKRLQDLRDVGVQELQIERIAVAEKQKIYNDDAKNAIAAAQRIADARYKLNTQVSNNKAAGLEEQVRTGNTNAIPELIKVQAEQLKAEKKKIDDDAAAELRKIEIDLKSTSLTAADRKALQAEQKLLKSGKPQAASKESLQLDFDSRVRQENLDKIAADSEDAVLVGENEKTRLMMRQTDLMEKLKTGHADIVTTSRQIIDNIRQQLVETKAIIQAKYAAQIAEKSGDVNEQNALRRKMNLETIDAEREALSNAKEATAEIDKQIAAQDVLNKKKHDPSPLTGLNSGAAFSGVESTGFASFGEGFGKAIYTDDSKGKSTDSQLSSKLGINTYTNREAIKDPSVARLPRAGIPEGTPLSDKRNADILAAGAAADSKGRPQTVHRVEGEAKILVELTQAGSSLGKATGSAALGLKQGANESNNKAPLGQGGT